MKLFRNLLADNRGVAAVELGLILGLLVIGMVGTLTSLGGAVKASYEDTAQKVANAR
ncbi:MAG: Flp family type IVb pilin [Novosphingobium sp.]